MVELESSIVTSVNSIFKSLVGQSLNIDDAEDKLDIWDRAIQYLNDYSNINDTKVKNVSDNFIKFIDKVNGADLDKLKETTEMFRQMAAFSESISGDFDKLADALNEKIAPLLEKISGSVEKMPKAINDASDKASMLSYELAPNSSKAQVSDETISKISNKTEAQKMQEKRDKAIAAGGYSGTIEDIIAILTDEGVKIGRR
jgi:methyl-accepting chemotaxis protein